MGLPEYPASGMESWGLVSIRGEALLITNITSLGMKLNLAETVAHQTAHQWFGNLVTLNWWSYLWLSKGFATYSAYSAIDTIFPDWNIWDQFMSNPTGFVDALQQDCYQYNHAVEVEVDDPHEIDTVFTEASYLKGAALLRMLSMWIGEEVKC